jgi:hypothetical protein
MPLNVKRIWLSLIAFDRSLLQSIDRNIAWMGGAPAALVVSSVMAHPYLTRLQFLRISPPEWLKYAFLAAPVGFLLTLLLLSKVRKPVRFALAVVTAIAGALITPVYVSNVSETIPLTRELNYDEESALDESLEGPDRPRATSVPHRYMPFPSAFSGELLIVRNSDADKVTAFLRERGLLRNPR